MHCIWCNIQKLIRNRLSPRYINIAITRYNFEVTAGAKQHNQAQKKEKKRKENNANIGGSTKTKMTHNRCALRKNPTTILALRITVYQASPPRRKATMMTLLPGLVLGFPPVRYGEWGKRYTRHPSRRNGDTRKHHRVGAKMTWISPDPQKTTSPDNL
jgi:hypothetical protein